MMRVIIAGDRNISDQDLDLIEAAIAASGFKITQVLSGKATGGDALGERWAKRNKVKVREFPADWKNLTAPNAIVKTGKWGPYNARAGFDRNQEMADAAEALIALQPNGDTSGTQDMVERAKKRGLQVFVWPPNNNNADTAEDGDYAYTF